MVRAWDKTNYKMSKKYIAIKPTNARRLSLFSHLMSNGKNIPAAVWQSVIKVSKENTKVEICSIMMHAAKTTYIKAK